jgi:predicted HicB family RNase H-like nuclease
MAPRKTTKRDSTESDEDEEQKPATPPPPKKAKKAKNNSVNNDDDESDSLTKIPPNSFMDFIQDLKEYGKEKLNHKGKPDISKIADGIPLLQRHHDLYSHPSFNSDFNALFITAARRKNIYTDLVVEVIDRYLNDGQTVETFPGFPKAPSRPINAYISENRDVDHGSLDDIVKLRQKFASGTIDTKKYFDTYAEECKVYVEKLKRYLEKNSSKLRETHKTYITNLIKRTSKSVDAKPHKKAKKEKKTAFEWYKDANPELYADKDEETRDRKLQKKFDKLDENEKRIYENIAAKNS